MCKCEWLDIETAPKDGTTIDLWLESFWANNRHEDGTPSERGETVRARRLTNCRWIKDGMDYESGETREGWSDFKMMVIMKSYEKHITHWMPLPAPPEEKK